MKTITIMIVAAVCVNVLGYVTAPLSDKEVEEYNRHQEKKPGPGKYVQRQYRQDVESAFKLRHTYIATLKSVFCEALVNTVVRLKTAHLRQHVSASANDVSWVKSENGYRLSYHGEIRDGLLIREVSGLRLPGMPELKTVNGQISDNPRVSVRMLKQALALISKDGVKIADVRVIVPVGQGAAAKEFIESLGLQGCSLICETAKGGPQVLLRMK